MNKIEHKISTIFFSINLNICFGCSKNRLMETMFVCVDAISPIQQFFSNVRIFYCLPGLHQY